MILWLVVQAGEDQQEGVGGLRTLEDESVNQHEDFQSNSKTSMFAYVLQYFLNFSSSPEKFIELSKFETYPPLLFEIFPDSSQ